MHWVALLLLWYLLGTALAQIPEEPLPVSRQIPHHLLSVGDTVRFDLTEVFRGLALSYEADIVFGDANAVNVQLEDATLRVTAQRLGYADIVVTASGPGGVREQTDLFRIRVAGQVSLQVCTFVIFFQRLPIGCSAMNTNQFHAPCLFSECLHVCRLPRYPELFKLSSYNGYHDRVAGFESRYAKD